MHIPTSPFGTRMTNAHLLHAACLEPSEMHIHRPGTRTRTWKEQLWVECFSHRKDFRRFLGHQSCMIWSPYMLVYFVRVADFRLPDDQI